MSDSWIPLLRVACSLEASYTFGAVGRVDGPWHASPEMLELLPSVCQVHPQPGFGLPWQVCLGLLRPVSVAIQQWEQLPLDVMFRRILCPGQVGRNVQAGSYSPAIEEVNARQGRYLLIGPDRCRIRHMWVEMSGPLHMQKGLFIERQILYRHPMIGAFLGNCAEVTHCMPVASEPI